MRGHLPFAGCTFISLPLNCCFELSTTWTLRDCSSSLQRDDHWNTRDNSKKAAPGSSLQISVLKWGRKCQEPKPGTCSLTSASVSPYSSQFIPRERKGRAGGWCEMSFPRKNPSWELTMWQCEGKGCSDPTSARQGRIQVTQLQDEILPSSTALGDWR